VFTDSEPIGTRKWMPCWDLPSDKATFELFAKVPSTVLLASNGLLKDSIKIADTIFYHWKSRDPISTYLMVITSKDGYKLQTTYWHPPLHPQDSVPMRFYYNDGENPQPVVSIMSSMADFFSNTFTEHPFEKNGFATLSGDFAWGGMENQTLTSLCPSCWQEMLAVHEFAHQWFGDMITCATWADIWLNESFATFSESLWLEHTQGYTAYRNDVESNANSYLSQNPGWAISEPSWALTTPNANILFNYQITYAKGACVLAQLRYVMGDTAFFNGMKNYTNDAVNFKLNTATIPDFYDKMQQSSGQDLDWFMNEWIYTPNHPIYTLNTVVNTLQVTTTMTQIGANFYKMPVELKYTFDDLSDTTIRVMNDVNNQNFSFTFTKPVTAFQFDPNNQIVLKQVQSSTVGVKDAENIHFEIYPNPASETLNIAMTPSTTNQKLVIRNSAGQEVYNTNISSGTAIKEISLKTLSAGVYTLQLVSNTTSITKRIVVAK
jgi:aminopeptidase N